LRHADGAHGPAIDCPYPSCSSFYRWTCPGWKMISSVSRFCCPPATAVHPAFALVAAPCCFLIYCPVDLACEFSELEKNRMAPCLVRKHDPRRRRGGGSGEIRFMRENQPTADHANAARASTSSSAFSSVARSRLIRSRAMSLLRMYACVPYGVSDLFATVPYALRFALSNGIYKIPEQDRL